MKSGGEVGQGGSNDGGYILKLEPTGSDDRCTWGVRERKGSKKSSTVHPEHLELCCPMQWPQVTFGY